MIDTHCHIDLYSNPKSIAQDCERLGIITIGMTNLPSHFELGYPHLLNFKKVRLALGMHPLYSNEHDKELPLFYKNLERTTYIGEIGLDYSKEGKLTKEIQLNTFRKILTVVQGKQKILSIHSRGAESDVLEMLVQYRIKSAIFHWYSGPVKIIQEAAELGYMFSVNPLMTKSKNGQNIIRAIPKGNILTESDGPFTEYEGKILVPSDVKVVLQYLASQWGMNTDVVEDMINDNFRKLIRSLN